MRQSDPLQFVHAGSLHRPGMIGRLLRFALGAFCLWVLAQLALYWQTTTSQPVSTLPNRVLVIGVPLYLINYVVKIGFGRSWGRRPLLVTVTVLAVAALAGWLLTGSPDNALLGTVLNLWLVYFYAHLGISFLLAALIATPGCEMRAIPELKGRITGNASEEHCCPVALLTRIDAWERERQTPR